MPVRISLNTENFFIHLLKIHSAVISVSLGIVMWLRNSPEDPEFLKSQRCDWSPSGHVSSEGRPGVSTAQIAAALRTRSSGLAL